MTDPVSMGIWRDRKDGHRYLALRDESDILTVPESMKEMLDTKVVSETGIWTADAFAKRFVRG